MFRRSQHTAYRFINTVAGNGQCRLGNHPPQLSGQDHVEPNAPSAPFYFREGKTLHVQELKNLWGAQLCLSPHRKLSSPGPNQELPKVLVYPCGSAETGGIPKVNFCGTST